MANYNNDYAFAKGFEALSGLLNTFLQNKIQDNDYEKRVQDSVATNMYNNAVAGKGDLYKDVPEQTVAGHKFSTVANNDNGDVSVDDFQKLRSGELSYRNRVNGGGVDDSNYRVKLDNNSANLINKAYGTKYNVGDVVPYSLFSGVSTMSNTQDRIANSGAITPKEAASKLMAGFNNYMKNNPFIVDKDKAFDTYMQNPLSKYYASFLGDGQLKEIQSMYGGGADTKDNDPLGVR